MRNLNFNFWAKKDENSFNLLLAATKFPIFTIAFNSTIKECKSEVVKIIQAIKFVKAARSQQEMLIMERIFLNLTGIVLKMLLKSN